VGRNELIGWVRLQWDRVGAWACLLGGAITLLVGWLGVSQTPYTAKQLPYIASCGLGGIFLLGTAAMLWLSADLRDEWRKLDRIEVAIRECGTAGLENAARQTEAAKSVTTVDVTANHRAAPRPSVGAGSIA
jgi:hypothetical protein